MQSKENRTREFRALCAEPHADDGVDPRRAFTRESKMHRAAAERKTRQLCKQSGRALAAALAGESGDERLRLVEIVGIEPAPDSSRLCVIVRVPADGGSNVEWRDRLHRATGFLRACLAGVITRKRVPELTFSLQRCGAEGEA